MTKHLILRQVTAITSEIESFNQLSASWWNSQWPMPPLHWANALRLQEVVEQIDSPFGWEKEAGLTRLRMHDLRADAQGARAVNTESR